MAATGQGEMTLPDGTIAVIAAFAQTADEMQGDLVIEIGCDGKPVEAEVFADLIKNTVSCLKHIDRCIAKDDGRKPRTKWALIESAICGDRASFTLRGYDKEVFKRQPKSEAAT